MKRDAAPFIIVARSVAVLVVVTRAVTGAFIGVNACSTPGGANDAFS
jgi:ABC-type methionine transport system permease subunit